MWGDINGDGVISFSDLTLMSDGVKGTFRNGATLQNLDIFPCIPDGLIDDFDLNALQHALNSLPFPCRAPCVDDIAIQDWVDFQSCLEGPGFISSVQCAYFDLNYDNVIDLRDVSLFMIRP